MKTAADERVSGNLLLALHTVFRFRRPSGVSTEQLITRLEMMLAYVRLLRDWLCVANSTRHSTVQQLFGFRAHGDKTFIVIPGTYLSRHIPPTLATATDNGILIMEHNLENVYKRSLLDLIRDQVKQLEVLRTAEKRALDEPCLQLFLFGSCTKSDCFREHIAEEAFTATYYNLRVRAHILALMILGAVDGLVQRGDIVRQER